MLPRTDPCTAGRESVSKLQLVPLCNSTVTQQSQYLRENASPPSWTCKPHRFLASFQQSWNLVPVCTVMQKVLTFTTTHKRRRYMALCHRCTRVEETASFQLRRAVQLLLQEDHVPSPQDLECSAVNVRPNTQAANGMNGKREYKGNSGHCSQYQRQVPILFDESPRA